MQDYRVRTNQGLQALLRVPAAELGQTASKILAADTVWDIAHPINRLEGREAVMEKFILPLRAALAHCYRRDEIFIGGENIREEGGVWCASVTHYVGNFDASFVGIAPSRSLVFLRAGEFYRLDQGKISEARIILDLPDLMRQAGQMPFPAELGNEMLFPGPATHDGVFPEKGDGKQSLSIVEGMLGDLHIFDPETFSSKDQTGDTGYWHPNMMWYGPCGIGSNFRWKGFVKDHRESFLKAFPDRKGGNHYCRIGDGNYAAVSGWPSMNMTFQGDYLGIKADGRQLTLRVMDFYRMQEGKIAENWVLLDYGELAAQMGCDLFGAGI